MQPRTISGEMPFQVQAHSFSVSPSASGYTLAYSADGASYTNYSEATPANEVLIVNGVANNMYFKLVGNSGDVTVVW